MKTADTMSDRIENMRRRCNLILTRMNAVGFDVVDNADDWTEVDMEYLLSNYAQSYITNYRDK